MNKLYCAKKITTWIVGAGAGIIAKRIIENNVQPDKTTEKVAVGTATLVIGSMAADVTSRYTDAKIEEFFEQIESFKKANIK